MNWHNIHTHILLSGLLILATGCSKQDPAKTPTQAVPIRLEASTASKAAVATGDRFTAAVAGWETAGNTGPDYTAEPTWLSKAGITASETIQAVTLTPGQHYSTGEGIRTCMKAWYPAGTLTAKGIVSFAGDDSYTADGSCDVLLSNPVEGSKDDAGGKTLTFRHPLSQLRFCIVADRTEGISTTLLSILVKEARIPSGIRLAQDELIYADPAGILLRGIPASGIPITPTVQKAGLPLLLKPFDGSMFLADITTPEQTYTDVTVAIDGDAAFVPGKAYTVTLTFITGKPVGVKVSIGRWQEIDAGEGEIPM